MLLATIWRQTPKLVSCPGSGNYGGAMALSADGQLLYIAAGDRQEAGYVQVNNHLQELDNTLGKIVRIRPDGSIPADNPFAGQTGKLGEIWTLGHRNPYGLAFDGAGQLWEHENGPLGGDEFNLIVAGQNYGWPNVSNGTNYDGTRTAPPHMPGDGYTAPVISWTPSIAPSGLIFYTGDTFGAWKGDAILGSLKGSALLRVRVSGTTASEVQRIDMHARIRSVNQSPDGTIWVLEDAPSGRLLRLAPVF